MFNTANLRERFHTEKTAPGVRMIGTFFAIVCTLPAIASTIYFPALIVSLPGVILTVFYWRIMLDRSDYAEARGVWNFTILYNLVLGGIIIYMVGLNPFESTLSINILAIGLAALAKFNLKEEANH
ncbi:MAG: hypothetical protein AAFR61_21320 [Bacteroidota bacterium]